MKIKPIIFVSSAFSGNEKQNRKLAIEYARIITDMGGIPIVPHLMFPEWIDGSTEEGYMLSMEMCKRLIVRSVDAVVACTLMNEFSRGMDMEMVFSDQYAIDYIQAENFDFSEVKAWIDRFMDAQEKNDAND